MNLCGMGKQYDKSMKKQTKRGESYLFRTRMSRVGISNKQADKKTSKRANEQTNKKMLHERK